MNNHIGRLKDNMPFSSGEKWHYRDAEEYTQMLIEELGPPGYASEGETGWENVLGFTNLWVRDESIPHSFPKPHRDYVYSTREIRVNPKQAAVLAFVSGSIIVDQLKGEVHARCGTVYANATTLGFVEDLVKGKVPLSPKQAKAEYAKRIKGQWLPDWYEDELGERGG